MQQVPLRSRTGAIRTYALVDDEDFDRVMARGNWSLDRDGYAQRTEPAEHGQTTIRLHRFVLELPPRTPLVDHRDRDKLNNQKTNLRIVTFGQNRQNLDAKGQGKSGHRGVSWNRGRHKWEVRAGVNGQSVYLGQFAELAEADAVAKAWRSKHMPFSEEAVA